MTTVAETPAPIARVDRRSRSTWWSLYVLTMALAALTSFAFLGRNSLYLDETVSTSIATASWHAFAQSVLHRESNGIVFYVLLRGWLHVGRGDAVVRTLSVIASLGALSILLLIARRLFGTRPAIIGGVLLAVNPLIIELAQDARGYALSLLLVSASSALFVRGVRYPRAGWPTWAGYVAVSALAGYANYWAALVPLAHYVSLAFLPRDAVAWRRLVPSGISIAVLLVPMGLLIRSEDSAGVNWAAGTAAGHVFSRVRSALPHAVIDAAAFIVVAVAVGLVVVLRRHLTARKAASADQSALVAVWPFMFALSWLVIPLAVVVLLSFVYKPLLVVRYLVVCLPPAAMLVGVGLARLKRGAFAAGLASLVVLSGLGLAQWYKHGQGENWRGALNAIAARSETGDGVVVFPAYMRIPLQWYLADHPATQGKLQPVFPSQGWRTDVLRFDRYVPVSAAVVSAAAEPHQRVWLVLSQSELYPSQRRAVLDGLDAAGFKAERSYRFAGIHVVRYAAQSAAAR